MEWMDAPARPASAVPKRTTYRRDERVLGVGPRVIAFDTAEEEVEELWAVRLVFVWVWGLWLWSWQEADVMDAAGVRVRDVTLSPKRVSAYLGALEARRQVLDSHLLQKQTPLQVDRVEPAALLSFGLVESRGFHLLIN